MNGCVYGDLTGEYVHWKIVTEIEINMIVYNIIKLGNYIIVLLEYYHL